MVYLILSCRSKSNNFKIELLFNKTQDYSKKVNLVGLSQKFLSLNLKNRLIKRFILLNQRKPSLVIKLTRFTIIKWFWWVVLIKMNPKGQRSFMILKCRSILICKISNNLKYKRKNLNFMLISCMPRKLNLRKIGLLYRP